jgi:hypothetical protein
MIDRTALLEDLKRLVTRVEADLLARSEDADVPEIAEVLRGEYERARAAKRTADTYGEWREDRITQAAVAWVLSCVFVRFLEDNDLISPPRVAGPGERLRDARDAHQHYFLSHPRDTDREYLLSIFDELAASPGTSGIFGPHNALREIPNWLSGDKAREVIQFFQKIDANTGLLIHDFTDPAWDTRFLGDLYQDLSAYARSRYALLQTPHFIEQFLLDRTLEPAIDEFGLTESFKMIDPACGSGHLVLGSFERILDRWQRSEPATPVRELVRRTLGSVHGVDINPFAVAIARFRLLLVAMRACGIKRLADAPDFRLNIECGDSLLHVPLIGGQTELFDKHDDSEEQPKRGRTKKVKSSDDECEHAYASENLAAVKAMLRHGQYHAVMANPPYIQVTDAVLNLRYRARFSSCFKHYSLAVPFCEHVFRLGVNASLGGGFTGQITANTFMKAEFGKQLVEDFFPSVHLSLVVDSSTVSLPGHGTPTVILFGRNRPYIGDVVRVVSGTVGEHPTPVDPAKGQVWCTLTRIADCESAKERFGTVATVPRARLFRHPWSIGGAGAAELKESLQHLCTRTLDDVIDDIGRIAHSGEDSAFYATTTSLRTRSLAEFSRPLIAGEAVRDGVVQPTEAAVFPYHGDALVPCVTLPPALERYLWPMRTSLASRVDFGKTVLERGMKWFEYSMFFRDRHRARDPIAQAFVATHNQFAIGPPTSCVSNQTAPVLLVANNADKAADQKIGLVWLLNCSCVCFWLKQVCFPKGGDQVGGDGARVRKTLWDEHYNFNSTQVRRLPIPATFPVGIATQLQSLACRMHESSPVAAIRAYHQAPTQLALAMRTACDTNSALRHEQIGLQEELDWECYRLYGLLDVEHTYGKPLPPVRLGERAFEIVMARRMAAGDLTSTWFERHGSTPITDIPTHWPADYRALVQKRIDAITTDKNIGLIEQPEYKRRWNTEPWESQQAAALEAFLLDRLERLFDFDGRMNDAGKPTATLPMGLVSIGGLADAASHDPLFMEAAEVFVGAAGFDVTALVGQLVEKASVPFLPVLRYKAPGLRKHEAWKEVWEFQRQEDAIDARTSLPSDDRNRLTTEQAADLKRREVGDIPVPPKYASADFASSIYWSLRGKLDVPKERFVSFPFVTGADGQTMIAWAGLDHLQLAKAIGDFYGLVQTDIGGSDDPRLVPLLAAIHELIPWIRQWHAGNDPVYGGEPADFFEDFLRTEAAGRGMTVAEVIAWQPPARTRAKRAAKKAAKRATRRSRSEPASPTPESAES